MLTKRIIQLGGRRACAYKVFVHTQHSLERHNNNKRYKNIEKNNIEYIVNVFWLYLHCVKLKLFLLRVWIWFRCTAERGRGPRCGRQQI
jgi:hypothetical protein